MKLPNPQRAVVDIAKLRDYCLSTTHPHGKHKARVFAAALDLHAPDAGELEVALLRAAHLDAVPMKADSYGSRYTIDFEMEFRARRAPVRSSWIVRASEDFPRLTTCFVV